MENAISARGNLMHILSVYTPFPQYCRLTWERVVHNEHFNNIWRCFRVELTRFAGHNLSPVHLTHTSASSPPPLPPQMGILVWSSLYSVASNGCNTGRLSLNAYPLGSAVWVTVRAGGNLLSGAETARRVICMQIRYSPYVWYIWLAHTAPLSNGA